MDSHRRAARTGWRAQEEELLFHEAERGRSGGMPLKAVFDRVAKATGRQPNSVRNYYYARIKADDALARSAHCSAFVSFGGEEMRELLKTVLKRQALGQSVRAITLDMGGGDTKAMLRYQNKYRSLIKTNRALVESVRQELEEEGEPAFDPYAVKKAPKSAENLVDVVSSVVNDLSFVPGLDVTGFFENLGALALAARGVQQAPDAGDRHVYAQLKSQIRAQQQELDLQRERFERLLDLYRRLVTLNRSFLKMTGVSKMSSLSSYVRELSESVEHCDKVIGRDGV